MKLKSGHLIHMGEENLNWVSIYSDKKWWACRDLSIGSNPTLLTSYSNTHPLDADAEVHLHAHVLSYPVPMLAALLNSK